MTTPDSAMTAPAAAEASVMDDIIEIFYAPSKVFARRRDNPKFWAAFIIFSILFALGIWVMMRNYAEVMDAQMTRQMNARMAADPRFTAEMAEKGRHIGQAVAPFIGIVYGVISTLVLGLAVWLVGKLFDSKADLRHGMMIATLSSFPKLIDLIIAAVIALTAGTAGITNMLAAGPSLARFAPATASPAVLGVLSRLSIGTIWATILIGIGLHVAGRTTKSKGYSAAIVVWIVATLVVVLQAVRQGA
jgi:tetrahydromethanopterin S-methyltransferase subunit G